MKTVCAALIVKNEGKILARCLRSIKAHIDYWVIIDTGSTDDTKEVIRRELSGVRGELYERPWINFGHNRSELMGMAKGKSNYILLIDADMVLNVSDSSFRSRLFLDSYLIKYEGKVDYKQKMLVNGRHDWVYTGVTHEYVHSDSDKRSEYFNEISLTHFCDGDRHGRKLQEDIQLLEAGLTFDPENARYMFYLANSYRDLKMFDKAIEFYDKRVTKEGWDQEIYYSLYQKAICLARSQKAFPIVEFLIANRQRSSRLEALYEVVRSFRLNSFFREGYELGKNSLELPYPSDTLFVDKEIHEWKFYDEFSICAFYAGDKAAAKRCIDLAMAKCGETDRKRIEKNSSFLN